MIPSAARIAARANHPILSNWLKLATSAAVLTVLTPICVAKFLQDGDAQAHLAALRGISSNWEQGQY
jgi:hypothetical protein